MKTLFKFLWRYKFIIYVLVLILIGFSVGALELTMNPKFCGSCHEMKHVYKTWEHSTHATYYDEHKRAGCMDCHAEPGLIGLLKAKIFNGGKSGFYHVKYMFAKNKYEIYQKIIRAHAEAPYKACLKCHKDIGQKDVVKGMYVPHHSPDTEFRNEMCSKCHEFVVHANRKYGDEVARKDLCINCHKKEEVDVTVKDCTTCHVVQNEMYNGKGLKNVKGEKDVMADNEVACTDCHSNYNKKPFKITNFKPVVQSCIDCHDDKEYGAQKIAEMQEGIKEKIPEIGKELIELREKIALARRFGKNTEDLMKYYNLAKEDYNFIKNDGSFGVHNHEYTISILEDCQKNIENLKKLLLERGIK